MLAALETTLLIGGLGCANRASAQPHPAVSSTVLKNPNGNENAKADKTQWIVTKLDQIPGLSPQVRSAQNSLVKIRDSVWSPQGSGVYRFLVTPLHGGPTTKGREHQVYGDAARLDHFVREIHFLTIEHDEVESAGDGVADVVRQAGEKLKDPRKALHGVLMFPNWLFNTVAEGTRGERDLVEEFKDRSVLAREDARIRVASENGLNYFELETDEAKDMVQSLAEARTLGGAAVGLVVIGVPSPRVLKLNGMARTTGFRTVAELLGRKRYPITDWSGYPANMPRPTGPFSLLEGPQYLAARSLANKANQAMHKADPSLAGKEIHEIQPIKFGGHPTDPANKIALTPSEHAQVTAWWNRQQRVFEDKLP